MLPTRPRERAEQIAARNTIARRNNPGLAAINRPPEFSAHFSDPGFSRFLPRMPGSRYFQSLAGPEFFRIGILRFFAQPARNHPPQDGPQIAPRRLPPRSRPQMRFADRGPQGVFLSHLGPSEDGPVLPIFDLKIRESSFEHPGQRLYPAGKRLGG